MAAGFHFHFDAGLTDERGHTWTSFGAPNVQSSAAKFGAAGVTLNGSSGLYIEPAGGGDFQLSGTFTIEGWAKIATGAAGHLLAMSDPVGGEHKDAWSIWFSSTTLRLYSGWHGNVITAASIPRDTYFHWAWTRDSSNDMRLFIDGVLQGTFSDSWSIDPTLVTLFSYITAYANNGLNLTGDADEWIWDPGVCRYTANFTPPTAPFSGPATGLILAEGPAGPPTLVGSQQAGLVLAGSPLGAVEMLGVQQVGSVLAAAPLGAPTLLGLQQVASIWAPAPLGTPSLQGAQQFGQIAAPSPTGAAALLAMQQAGSIAAAGPLGAATILAWHDFTGSVVGSTTYVMDLVTTGGLVRVPISSWQATLQTDAACYVQCVVPAAAPWVATILDATEFIISRRARLADGTTIEYEMARSPLEQREPSQGPGSYTVVLSGYPDALTANADPPAEQDRSLQGVRSVSGLPGGMRVRADIDWLLRPGMRALYGSTPILVDYINYYVPGNDQYMDVGERA